MVTEADAVGQVIRRRRMVRRYADRPVAESLVDELLGLALRAPSAGFTQAVSWVVLTGDSVRRFWALTSDGAHPWLDGMKTAPMLLLAYTDEGAYRRRYAEPDKAWTDLAEQPWSAPYWWVDAGMAAQNVLLGAEAQGLGACFFGVPLDRQDSVRDAFGVPEGQLSVGVISLGWPADDERPIGSPRRRARRTHDELIHREAW